MTAQPVPAHLNADDAMRIQRGWPTPNHMRTTADALDMLTPACYGDVLRWFADRCDAAPDAADPIRPPETDQESYGTVATPDRWDLAAALTAWWMAVLFTVTAAFLAALGVVGVLAGVRRWGR